MAHVCMCGIRSRSHRRASAGKAFTRGNAAIYSYSTVVLKSRRSWFRWGWDWMLEGMHTLSAYKPKLWGPRALNLPFSPVPAIQYY